jgi:Resolvase, N terminal domain
MMNALGPRPEFDVIVMSEESLGRESIETAYALKQIVSAGVRVFFYLEGRERTLDTSTDKLLMSVTAFADELEREKARQRTYDAMQRKAKAGHVTGGRVFGYVCSNMRERGTCNNRSWLPMPLVDSGILESVEKDVLTERRVTAVISIAKSLPARSGTLRRVRPRLTNAYPSWRLRLATSRQRSRQEGRSRAFWMPCKHARRSRRTYSNAAAT